MRYQLVTGKFDGKPVRIRMCDNGDFVVQAPDGIAKQLKKLYDSNDGWAGLSFGEFVAKMIECDTTPPTST